MQNPYSCIELNLDLDGVFVAFYQRAHEILGVPYESLPGAEAWFVLDRVPHLFRDIPLLPDAMMLWNGIQAIASRDGNIQQRVLSALPLLTNELDTAPADKIEWVRGNLSQTIPVALVSGGAAKVLYVRRGAVLIDDLARNILLWEQAGGIGILHRSAAETLAQLEKVVLAQRSNHV